MSTYMLLIIEPPAQRATRTEAHGREVYARMGHGRGAVENAQAVSS